MRQTSIVQLVLMLCLAGLQLSSCMIKPAIPLKDMDPIDGCLFGCHMCFEKYAEDVSSSSPAHQYIRLLLQELQLECANTVCLRDLPMGRPLGKLWSRACPELHEIFPVPSGLSGLQVQN